MGSVLADHISSNEELLSAIQQLVAIAVQTTTPEEVIRVGLNHYRFDAFVKKAGL